MNPKLFLSLILLCGASFFLACQTEKGKGYDAIIYGGTPAGITTAIELARKEKQVLLVVQQGQLGGMYAGGLMTSEVMHMKKQCISGLAHEYYMRVSQETPAGFVHKFTPGEQPAYFFECKTAEKVFEDWLAEYEAFIEIRYEAEISALKKEGNRIRAIALNGKSPITGAYFVDCSYEGDLMRMAGSSYAVGREAQDKYGEQFAGIRFQPDTLLGTTVDAQGNRLPYFQEKADLENGAAHPCVAAYNFRCVLTKVDSNQVPFTQPQDYDSNLYYALNDFLQRNPETQLRDLFGIIKRGNGKTGFNTRQGGASSISVGLVGMQCDYPEADYEERDRLRARYKQYTQGLFYYLSHDPRVPEALQQEMASYGYAKDEFVENDHFPYYFYIREAARLQGEFVFTEHDLFTTREKEDAILLGSHWIDCHSIQKVALTDTTYLKEGRIWEKMLKPYEIPYRVMLPKEAECSNLLVPVAVSASHVGFCSIRLESTWMQLGHAAGAAIAQVMETKASLHGLDLPQLQETLRNEGMVVKLPEFDARVAADQLKK